MSQEDFFDGVSIPRNRELMRVYRDLELVEQLGSGIPRILQSYGRECFRFMDNFIRMAFPATDIVTPQGTPQDTPQDTPQVNDLLRELLNVFESEHNRAELQAKLGLTDREHFRKSYLQPAIDMGLVKLTIPNKPTSRNQRYALTEQGKQLRNKT